MANRLVIQNFRIALEEGLFIRGEVKVLKNEKSKPVILLSHGGRGHMNWGFWPYVSAWFAERGFYTVSFDFSRIGVKEDEVRPAIKNTALTFTRELLDLEALFLRIKGSKLPFAELADISQVTLLGHSRAGGTNLIFAAENPEINSIIVWNGGADLNPPKGIVFNEYVLADLDNNRQRFDVPQSLAAINSRALIIQGDQDSELLLRGNQILRKAAPNQSFVNIPGADHTFGTIHPFVGTTSYLEEALEVSLGFLPRIQSELQYNN